MSEFVKRPSLSLIPLVSLTLIENFQIAEKSFYGVRAVFGGRCKVILPNSFHSVIHIHILDVIISEDDANNE
ncbi:5803_t:CDS:2 [Rhizophagus irregularis]|nr:5803_t:CDS:2 [Rhizophagus irregularis]